MDIIVFVNPNYSGNIVLCINDCIDLYELMYYTYIKLIHWKI